MTWLSLAFPFLPFKRPFSYSLPMDIVFLCGCVSGQVCGCFKASVQKAQINPSAYVFRNYHVCRLVCILCVCVCVCVRALLAAGASPAVIRSLGTTAPVCLCSFSITAKSMGNRDKNGTVTELL